MQISDSQKWLVLAGLLLLGWLIVSLSPILSPFLTAILFAYMGDPLVDRLEQWKLSRTNGVIITFLLFTLVFVAAALLLVPALVRQIDDLITSLPAAFIWVRDVAAPYLESRFGLVIIQFDWLEWGKKLDWGATGNVVKSILGNLTQSGMALLGLLTNLVIAPVVTFYLLRDWDLLVERIGALVPRFYIGLVSDLAQQCHETLGAFFRGQLMVMFALSLIYSAGLMLMGLELSLLVGILAGLASIVPYLGTIVGIGAGLIAAYVQFGDITHLLLVVLVFSIGQVLEGTVLTPKLVGDRIGLHPVAVMFAVLAGGQLFGFVGILLALPAAAVIMVLLRRVHLNYRASRLYGQAEAAPEEPSETVPETGQLAADIEPMSDQAARQKDSE